MNKKTIFVTQPSLPPIEDYIELLKGVWDRKILTHNGPLVQRFEEELSQKLDIDNFIASSNGTLAIQLAIAALELKGEVITTSFSWIATISAIKWEGCTPVFCDIDPETLNIDPAKIEMLITDKTVAIVPVHVFGNPCDVIAIEAIAKKYNLKVIYDAAHAIGSFFEDKSILTYGDISATSLHATKLLNTAEGGGCVTNDKELQNKIKRLRFFGHDDNKDIIEDGLNGKMTEIQAALGIANLKYFDEVLEDRKNKYLYYQERINSNKNISFQTIKHGSINYSYFPVIFKDEKMLLTAQKRMNEKNIYPRRYFYPSLNTFSKVVDYAYTPISEDISNRILCLPLYWELSYSDIDRVIKIFNEV